MWKVNSQEKTFFAKSWPKKANEYHQRNKRWVQVLRDYAKQHQPWSRSTSHNHYRTQEARSAGPPKPAKCQESNHDKEYLRTASNKIPSRQIKFDRGSHQGNIYIQSQTAYDAWFTLPRSDTTTLYLDKKDGGKEFEIVHQTVKKGIQSI